MDNAKEQKAIEQLKAFEPEDGYYLAYSGGKDSDCIKILAQLSGVKFEAVHNLTTVDAPETVRYEQCMQGKAFKAINLVENNITIDGAGFKIAVDRYHVADLSTALGKLIFGVKDLSVNVNGINVKMDGDSE